MKTIRLYNTLTRSKEVFKPLKGGFVGMYHCGPTVYDYAHIGNLRTYVFADILRRTTEYAGYSTKQVTNITDIGHLVSDADDGEDKMTRALKREGKEMTLANMLEIGTFYMKAFEHDLDLLNIKHPHVLPRASEHVNQQISLIERLEKAGVAYQTFDGVYYDISKFSDYTKLGQLNIEEEKAGVRVSLNSEKRHPADFALWKFNDKLGWDSPWGKGFPGWHIECSAMSLEHLGEQFDIHTGGIDLIPTHHTNEIAQTEAATGKTFVNYWMHSAYLNMPEGKMAKSAGNFIQLSTLKEKNISPLAYRYLLLTAHYRSPLTFSWQALEGAQEALIRLIKIVNGHKLEQGPTLLKEDTGTIDEYKNKFWEFISNDLDTPKALALIWEMIKDGNLSMKDKREAMLDFDNILGLGFNEKSEELDILANSQKIGLDSLPENIQKLVQEREQSRKNKDFERSDAIRSQLEQEGFLIEDHSKGPTVISTQKNKPR